MNRREFLASIAGTAGMAVVRPLERLLPIVPSLKADPFTLGVASGDPTPTGVVLWTRLAPDPLHGGGMAPNAVAVRWQIASDPGMKRIVRQGSVQAAPELAHSVHVEADGLLPAHTYWYQFECGGVLSPVGRTRTAPAAGSSPERLRFALASCQDWSNGHYAAYRHMAQQDLDLVLHVGDYIYEGLIGNDNARDKIVPLEVRLEPVALDEYRLRYALYKMDPNLKAAHAAAPFVVTWDDHEVANNYANDLDQRGSDPADFLKRRAAAYQAYYEHTPLRRSQMPRGANAQLFRRLTYGDLAQFSVLDTRQYRSHPAHGGALVAPRDAEVKDPSRVLMGARQEAWLQAGLRSTKARWKVIPQQIWMSQFVVPQIQGPSVTMDYWDGYPAERDRLMRFLHDENVKNAVVLSGASHRNLVSELKLDFDRHDSPSVGVELAGTAISSSGVEPKDEGLWEKLVSIQPHLKWFEGVKRGYVTCTLDRKEYHADFWGVQNLRDPKSPVTKSASFVIEDGQPRVNRVS